MHLARNDVYLALTLFLSVESMLGLEPSEDFVAFDGSPFEYGAKVVAIGSQQRVDLML